MSMKQKGLMIPSTQAQEKILALVREIMDAHKSRCDYRDKFKAVDLAYARYKETGEDAECPTYTSSTTTTTPPVVLSQVDSMVSYLADVFLSGYPLFPVVSSPANKAMAEQLETLLDNHATLGGYPRQLLIFLKDAVKYNLSAVEVNWESIRKYAVVSGITDVTSAGKVDTLADGYSSVRRLDPYNLVFDPNTDVGDISTEGDYAGYIERLSRPKLRRRLQQLADEDKAFQVKEALASTAGSTYYTDHPIISQYVKTSDRKSQVDWNKFLGLNSDYTASPNDCEVLTLYIRITPADFHLTAPAGRRIQAWKFIIVNHSVLVSAERVSTAYDTLPILFGQPLEDGLSHQTHSIAEAAAPFQTSANTLLEIAYNAARRSVSDRAIYNPALISADDINSPVAAPKIPARISALGNFRLQDAYMQIPFDARGTEGATQNAMQMVSFGRELSGMNAPQRGEFQKGNKSVTEWRDTMSGADSRLRLPALTLEYQVFQPLKEMLKMNIFQYGTDAYIASQKTGEEVQVDINALRSAVLTFRVADGYTPKSKLAGTESVQQLMLMVSQSPILQQSFGAGLPQMFTHLAQLLGVRGLEEYVQQQQAMPAPQEGALNATPTQPSL